MCACRIEKEEDPVNYIRESSRNVLKLSRRTHREEETNFRRSLKETSITAEHIASIASKLKTKSAITATDLRTLRNGLMTDTKHIEVFLNENGALRGLVRELTGVDADKQYIAATCCCNLALGDAKACAKVAKAAGSYLVAALDSMNVDLAIACAWAVGNASRAGGGAWRALAAQGAPAALAAPRERTELQHAALYAMVQLAGQMKDELKPEHVQKIVQTLLKLELTTNSAHLLFILSCHDHFTENMTKELLEKLLNDLPSAIEIHNKQTKVYNKLLYIVRTLANTNTMYGLTLSYCLDNNVFGGIRNVMNRNNLVVNNSLFWLLGNLCRFCGDDSLFVKLLS